MELNHKLKYYILGIDSIEQYPKFLLAMHSSKRLLVETVSPPTFILADALINLTLSKGQRHEV
jgi:calpain-15